MKKDEKEEEEFTFVTLNDVCRMCIVNPEKNAHDVKATTKNAKSLEDA